MNFLCSFSETFALLLKLNSYTGWSRKNATLPIAELQLQAYTWAIFLRQCRLSNSILFRLQQSSQHRNIGQSRRFIQYMISTNGAAKPRSPQRSSSSGCCHSHSEPNPNWVICAAYSMTGRDHRKVRSSDEHWSRNIYRIRETTIA